MAALFFNGRAARLDAAEWQWSVPEGDARIYLWIPPACERVRGVVFANHNMSEQGILEHPTVRDALRKLDFAAAWAVPSFDATFDFNKGAGGHFDRVMHALADESGYQELRQAPVVPIGHSACATYPWNFAAWNPGRTLAILSVHGDAPQTTLTGNGKPRVDWGSRNIDGVPGLMVMGEYEWVEGRLATALEFQNLYPRTPVAVLSEPGRGHFDVSEDLINFLVLFIRKAAEQRLPAVDSPDQAPVLRPVEPSRGWLVERWQLDQMRKNRPAPFAKYAGDAKEAFWCFDDEMALATQDYRAAQIGKKPQLLGWKQEDHVLPQSATHNQVSLKFKPLADGLSFRLGATFLDQVEAGSPNLVRWTQLPVGTPLGHAIGGGPIQLSPITGPVVQTGPETFRVQFNRTTSTPDRRNNDIWLLASHPGDEHYKSAVQQALLRLPDHADGASQQIVFPEIPNQTSEVKTLTLTASSDAGLPVSYYVREGPAEIEGDTLKFTAIPPRAKFPVKVTVIAWQWGHSTDPKIKTAKPVERQFSIRK